MHVCRMKSDGTGYKSFRHNDPRDYFAQIVILLSESYDVKSIVARENAEPRSYATSSDAYEPVRLCHEVSSKHYTRFSVAENPIAATFEVLF